MPRPIACACSIFRKISKFNDPAKYEISVGSALTLVYTLESPAPIDS
jgi:hypothetical protein